MKTETLADLWAVIDDRATNPREGSYVSSLLAHRKGIDKPLEKVGEEATEFVLAVKNGDPGRIANEAADLLFHLLVALRASGVGLDDVLAVLEARRQ